MVDALDDDVFENYVTKTVNPGQSMLIGSLIFSILCLALLPCLVSIGRRFQRHEDEHTTRDQQHHGSVADQDSSHAAAAAVTDGRKGNAAAAALKVDIKTANHKSRHSKTKRGSGVVDCPPYSSPYFSPGQPPQQPPLENNDGSSDGSSVRSKGSNASAVSSVAAAVMNAILDSSPHGGPYRNPLQYQVEQRHNKDNAIQNSSNNRATATGGAGFSDSDPSDDAAAGGDGASALGSIPHDAVSIRDAVDAGAAATSPPVKKGEMSTELMSPWERLLSIAEWDYESKRLTKLGVPFIGQALLHGVVEAIHVALIGRFVGTRALTAYVSVELFVGVTTGVLQGFQEALTAVASQALGYGNRRLAGQYVQIATVMFVICFVPVFLFWLVFIEDALRWLGYDEKTVKMGTDFTMLFLFARFLKGVHFTAHSLLDVIGKENYSAFFSLGQELVGIGGLLTVAVQPGTNDLQLIGLVLIAVEALGLVVNIVIIVCNGWFDRFLGGMVGSFALANVKATKLLLGTSFSLSLGQLLAYGEWELLLIFASRLGPAEAAAWGLLGTLWDAVELVTEAVADAAEVRTAFLLGAGEPEKAKRSAYKAVFLAIFAAVFITSLLFIGGEDIPTWLTTDRTLQKLTADLLPLFGLGNIALTIGTMAWTIVGAQGRYRLSTGIGFGGSWLISIPLAAFLSMYLKFDLKGQTAAIVVGYMVSGTINSYILLQSDWPKLSRRVIARAADAADDDDSDDDDSSSSSSSSSSSNGDEGRSNRVPAGMDRPTSAPSGTTAITALDSRNNSNNSNNNLDFPPAAASSGVPMKAPPTTSSSPMESFSRSFQTMVGALTEQNAKQKASTKA